MVCRFGKGNYGKLCVRQYDINDPPPDAVGPLAKIDTNDLQDIMASAGYADGASEAEEEYEGHDDGGPRYYGEAAEAALHPKYFRWLNEDSGDGEDITIDSDDEEESMFSIAERVDAVLRMVETGGEMHLSGSIYIFPLF